MIVEYNFNAQQAQNTEAEIKKMQEFAELIPLDEMQKRLGELGLKLDLNPNGYLLTYYNTSNECHYLQATTQPIDKKKVSVFNVNSDFYQQNYSGDRRFETGAAQKLKALRVDYFTVITVKKKVYILSF